MSDNLLDTDQRGHDHQTCTACDIGAYEFGVDFKLPNVPSITRWGLALLTLALGLVLAFRIWRVRRAWS